MAENYKIESVNDRIKGYNEGRKTNVMILSVGNPSEGHGKALPTNIDDILGVDWAVRAAKSTGAHYAGHIPFTTDTIGPIAKRWCPAYVPVDEFVSKTADFVERSVNDLRQMTKVKEYAVVIPSGHGGVPKDLGQTLSNRTGVKTTYVEPRFGHAGKEEHSVAEFIGILDHASLDEINALAQVDPDKALYENPEIIGQAGLYVHRDKFFTPEEAESVRQAFEDPKKPWKLDNLETFRKERNIPVDISYGQKITEEHVKRTVEAVMAS